MNASNRPLEGHRQVVHELGRPARRLIAGRRGRGRGDEEQASVSDCKRYTSAVLAEQHRKMAEPGSAKQ
jgi:hypothetical protein